MLKYLTEITAEETNAKKVCPFIVKFYASFQDSDNLYYELEYVQGCSLLQQIREGNQAVQGNMIFYASETLLALQFLHRKHIIYRDLKPENIVLSMNERGHLKLVDFGFAKSLTSKSHQTKTNCGTPAYIAPEILKSMSYSYEVDVWSFGVLMVEIISGQSPFQAEDTAGIYEKVVKCQPTYSYMVGPQLRDLLSKIFVHDQENRINFAEIKKHLVF